MNTFQLEYCEYHGKVFGHSNLSTVSASWWKFFGQMSMEKVNFNFVQPPTKMVNVVHEGDQKMKIHIYKGIRFNKLAIGHQIYDKKVYSAGATIQ